MSPSDPDTAIREAVAALDNAARAGALAPASVRAAVSAVARLYEKAVEQAGGEFTPVDSAVSTTAALTLSCALLRSQALTPFDMALWFSRAEGVRQ